MNNIEGVETFFYYTRFGLTSVRVQHVMHSQKMFVFGNRKYFIITLVVGVVIKLLYRT